MGATVKLVHRVKSLFGKHLLVTNVVSCGVLMGLGDAAVQKMEHVAKTSASSSQAGGGGLGTTQPPAWDTQRTGRMTLMGFAMGPLNHGWYTVLDAFLPGKSAIIVVKKILADQIIAAPFFACTYFIGSGTLERQPLKVSWEDLKAKFWTVYKADWTVWPAAQAVNFYLLPPQFRVIYVAVVTFGWNTFLSYVKHKDIKQQPSEVQLPVQLNAEV